MKIIKTSIRVITVCIIFVCCFLIITENESASALTEYSFEENEEVLPSEYESPFISPVKDQGWHGNCWIFATLATLESNLKAMGCLNEEDISGYYDFAEEAISFALVLKCPECGGHCTVNMDEMNYYCDECGAQGYGYTRIVNDGDNEGGFEEWVIGYLMSGSGLVAEEDYPYGEIYSTETENAETYDLRITEVTSIDPKDTAAMKKAIIDYGAVTLNFAADIAKTEYYFDDEANNFYYVFGTSQMLPQMGGHAVSLVGYDDNFSKDNFFVDKTRFNSALEGLTDATLEYYLDLWEVESVDEINAMTEEEFDAKFNPQKDGAWLVKNSWGSGMRDTYNYPGYSWISYDDISLYNLYPDSKAFAFTGAVRGETGGGKVYQLDETGAINCLPMQEELNNKHFAAANIYDFGDGNNKIDYVTFCTENGKGASYNLYYANVYENGEIESDFSRMALLKSGRISNNFYETVYLSDVIIPKGKGAIVMEVDGTKTDCDIKFGTDSRFGDLYSHDYKIYLTYFPLIQKASSFVISNGKLYNTYEAYNTEVNFTLKVGATAVTENPTITIQSKAYKEASNLFSASNYNEKYYTLSSWTAYKNAKAALECLISKPNFTTAEQTTLNNAAANLQITIEALELKDNRDGIFTLVITSSIIAAVILFFIGKSVGGKNRRKK